MHAYPINNMLLTKELYYIIQHKNVTIMNAFKSKNNISKRIT